MKFVFRCDDLGFVSRTFSRFCWLPGGCTRFPVPFPEIVAQLANKSKTKLPNTRALLISTQQAKDVETMWKPRQGATLNFRGEQVDFANGIHVVFTTSFPRLHFHQKSTPFPPEIHSISTRNPPHIHQKSTPFPPEIHPIFTRNPPHFHQKSTL